MNPVRHSTPAVFFWSACLFAAVLLCGSCTPYIHELYGMAGMTSHPSSLTALRRGDLEEAAHTLEPLLAAKPQDAELSYTLGCVYLMKSSKAKDHALIHDLQTRGWQLVESASGRYSYADILLAHAYLVGRWGKKKDSSQYEKHLRLSLADRDAKPPKMGHEDLRIWTVLMPP